MKSQLLKLAAICCLPFFSNNSDAQMVGTDIFLKGRFVEVGIGHLGYYGSDATPPAGYHPHYSSSALGFVADVGLDGWTVGTPPYMGDYFTSGFPAEGWALQVNGKQCHVINSGSTTTFSYSGGMSPCAGANTSYTTSGSRLIGTWQGVVDSIDITQITSLDTNSLFFTVKVIFTNTAVAPKSNIYYLRNVDPDNDATWGGSFSTTNLIEHQSTDTTVVSATGITSSSAYIAMGTTDTAATAIFTSGLYVSPGTNLASLYGTPNPTGTSDHSDHAIGLITYIPHLATVDSAGDSVYRTTAGAAYLRPANQATINYFFAFSTAARDSAIRFLDGTTTSPGTLAIKNVNTSADIKVYPNPSGEMVNITGLTTTDRVLVYDLMGRDMKQHWAVGRDGTNTFRYDNLPAGAYVLVITDAGGDVKARVPVRKM